MRNSTSARSLAATAATLLLLASTASAAADTDELQALREQIRLLDQKIRVLERKQELKDDAASEAAKKQPVITAGAGGFALASPDKAFELKLRAIAQADARFYLADDGTAGNNQFLLRRARAILTGTLGRNFEFALVPEFAGIDASSKASTFSVVDAWIAAKVQPALNLKFGKFASPVALEPGADRLFVESPFVNTLLPNRDLGVELYGTLADGLVEYRAGIYNGVRNNVSSVGGDLNDNKTFAGRLTVTPFAKSEGWGKGLGLAIGASSGSENGTLQNLVTNGQQTLANLGSLTGVGNHTRVSPAVFLYSGPYSFVAEYAQERHRLVRTAAPLNRFTATNEAWRVSGGYVLTGEESTARGVTPKSNFDPASGAWGAFELVGRVSGLDLDGDLFAAAASGGGGLSTTTNATAATAYGLGVNWYLNRNVRFLLNYEYTAFDGGGAANSAVADDEQALFSRLQVSF
ncbi:MAG: porin [Opitutaceae bacterium]